MGVIKPCITSKIYCKPYNSVVTGSTIPYCTVLPVTVLPVTYRSSCRDAIDKIQYQCTCIANSNHFDKILIDAVLLDLCNFHNLFFWS